MPPYCTFSHQSMQCSGAKIAHGVGTDQMAQVGSKKIIYISIS